jgi:hypothetical protein
MTHEFLQVWMKSRRGTLDVAPECPTHAEPGLDVELAGLVEVKWRRVRSA